ncbi:uncharacterized protein MONBRDRAFT_30626, partial [Monosiga brevicollis MX1]
MVLPDPSDTQQTHSDPSPPSASPPATAILPAAISHPVEHSEHANSAPLGEVSESETHDAAGEHSEGEQDVLLSDPAPPIAANVLDAQRKVLLKTSGHRQLLACPFGLCKCKGPRLDRKAWVNHVLREHPYDEQATDLVKQVMEAKLVAQCNKCHLFFEAAGISQHRSRCGANLKRASEALFHAAGHDLLEIMRGAWPQQCVGSRVSVCELLKLARHPLMQRSRYPSNATETKLMAATLSQLYWSAVHSDYTAEEREMCWALILALPSMLLSAPSTALSTIDLRNMFHDRLRWLKANGKFRPVGTDSIFNKVVNRALLEQQQPHIAHLLQASPELAVGVKDGISAAVGMAFGELQACESTPGWTMLSLDFKSAFNYTDRARLHEIVADKVPGLLRAFERHYARPTTHCIVDKFFKVIDIDVGQGIVQGNELSPFFFSLYSCEVLGLLDATTDYRCKVIKYLDDIVLMGPAEDVAADVEIVKARAESAGLHLQPSKSRFYMPRHHPASIAAIKSVLPDAVRETANTGMTVLGTPIGRREWMKKQLNDKAKHIAGKLNDMLTTGVSLQALLTAMQYVPSLINHLYTLPPSLTSGLSELLNRACKDTFVKAFFAKVNLSAPAGAEGHDVTLEQLLEARIFTRANTGGFGLHDLVERGPVAYVCNMAKLATRYPR